MSDAPKGGLGRRLEDLHAEAAGFKGPHAAPAAGRPSDAPPAKPAVATPAEKLIVASTSDPDARRPWVFWAVAALVCTTVACLVLAWMLYRERHLHTAVAVPPAEQPAPPGEPVAPVGAVPEIAVTSAPMGPPPELAWLEGLAIGGAAVETGPGFVRLAFPGPVSAELSPLLRTLARMFAAHADACRYRVEAGLAGGDYAAALRRAADLAAALQRLGNLPPTQVTAGVAAGAGDRIEVRPLPE